MTDVVTIAGWLYLIGGTVLFFFWVYGIVRFAMDLRAVYVPSVRQYVRGRAREQEEREQQREREERERQLY